MLNIGVLGLVALLFTNAFSIETVKPSPPDSAEFETITRKEVFGMTEFQEKLVLILIQYFAIALVVAFAGFLFSKALERYKARQALESELAKQQVHRIGECWSEMYLWEATVRDFVRRAAELQVEYSGDQAGFAEAVRQQMSSWLHLSEKQSEIARGKVEEHRFWLGDDLYANFREYFNSLNEYMTAFAEGNLSELKDVDARIESAKGDVVKALTQLQ